LDPNWTQAVRRAFLPHAFDDCSDDARPAHVITRTWVQGKTAKALGIGLRKVDC